MAVVKLSPFATGLSGAMKNLQFSSDGTITTMKERETPRDTPSAKKTANRVNFSLSSKGYALLSPTNLALWKSYSQTQTFIGKKGKVPYTPNAFEAYKSLTQVWYGAHGGVGTPPVTPPTVAYAPPQISVTAQASAGRVTIKGSAVSPANSVLEVRLQRLANANRKPSSSGYRIAGYATFTVEKTNEFSFTVTPGVYSAMVAWVNLLTGERSPYQVLSVSGVALDLQDGSAESDANKNPTPAPPQGEGVRKRKAA